MLRKITLLVFLIFIPLKLHAQTYFIVGVNSNSPTNITTTAATTQVTVQQQGATTPGTYYIIDSSIGASRRQQSPGSPYVFRSASGFATGTTVGTIQLAAGTGQFIVTQAAGPVPGALPVPVQVGICPSGQSVNGINSDGSLSCLSSTGSGVTSVSGTANNMTCSPATGAVVCSVSNPVNTTAATGITAAGVNAGNLAAVTGTDNTVYGNGAGAALTVPAMGATPAADTFFGFQAGAAATTCRESTLIGYWAGNALLGNGAGIQDCLDTMVGSQAGLLDKGIDEVFVGIKAGAGMQGDETSDQSNVMIGAHAGVGWYSGKSNLFLGNQANDGGSGEVGSGNVSVGFNALQATCGSPPGCGGGSYTKNNNVAIGQAALADLESEDDLIGIGYNAGNGCTTCNSSVFIGYNAGANTATNVDNTFIGYSAGQSVQSDDNTFIGYNSGQNFSVTGGRNTFIGSNSGDNATSSNNNVIIGTEADRSVTSAGRNVVIGESAGYAITSESNDTIVGDSAGNQLTNGTGHNSLLGYQAGHSCTTCTAVVGFGYQADFGAAISGAVQIGTGVNATNSSMQFQSYNFLNLYGPKLNQYCITGTGCAAGVTLPSAATAGAGTVVMVLDATTFAVGTCTGGGSDAMLAVSDGTNWSCH